MLGGVLLQANITCSCPFPDYIVSLEVRTPAQTMRPPGESLWSYCRRASGSADVVTETRLLQTLVVIGLPCAEGAVGRPQASLHHRAPSPPTPQLSRTPWDSTGESVRGSGPPPRESLFGIF